jgi:hypothetical protein
MEVRVAVFAFETIMMSASIRPRASVVMPVYGDMRFLDEAVQSILSQEMADLELVIVDDGGGKREKFNTLARLDSRIKLVVNESNVGAAVSANRGIDAARSDVIVRMDADDVAESSRVGELLAALEGDPDLGLVGSAVTLIDETGTPLGVQLMPETDLEIRWTILFHNPFYHPAVAFRRSCFEAAGRYRPHELVSQDHYLWFDMLPFCRARNLPEPLTRYRLNPQGLTATDAKNGRKRTHAVREAAWRQAGMTYRLYDDAPARDISQFLRGHAIAEPQRRAPAYQVILLALRSFLDKAQLVRDDDKAAARQLVGILLTRILARLPDNRADALSVIGACWKLDRYASLVAAARRLTSHRRS